MNINCKEIRVKDLGKVITGNTPSREKSEYYGSHTLFVKPTDINSDLKYTYITEEDYSELGFEKYKKSLIPKGSTCVVTIGSIGKKITKAHCDLFINQAMNAVIPNKEYNEDFIYYLLKLNLAQLKTLDSGTASGRENVSKSSFSNMKVKVPNLSIQKKIGKILSNYDDLIENNQKKIRLLEEKARLTYEEWFLRFRINGLKLEIDNDTGLPFGWELTQLKKIASFINGYAFKSNDFNDLGYPVIKIKNIDNNSVDIFNTDKISHKVIEKVNQKFKLNSGDLLIAMTGATVGKLGFVPYSDTSCYLNQRVGKIISDYLYFVYLSLNSEFGQQQILNFAGGAAQPNISGVQILNVKAVIPNDVELLTKFNELSSNILKEKINLTRQNQLLKESRDILLPRLMTGMIDVENIDIEV